jgi:hypothetical protein
MKKYIALSALVISACTHGTYKEPSTYDKFMDKFNAVPEKTKELGRAAGEPVGDALDTLHIRDAVDAVYDMVLVPGAAVITIAR